MLLFYKLPCTTQQGFNQRMSINIEIFLQQGNIIAYPTETVYGIGCDPQNSQSLAKINAIKGRNEEKGFIIISNKIAHLQKYTTFNIQNLQRTKRATTYLVPCKKSYQGLLTGNKNTVAIRLSEHPAIVELCTVFNGAIVSTSLNYSGDTPITEESIAMTQFANKVDLIIKGECGKQAPSRIVDLESNKVIRN